MTAVPITASTTPQSAGGHYVLIASPQPDDATTTLFFHALATRRPDAIRIMRPERDHAAAMLGGASAVIVVRALLEWPEIIRTARDLKIPLYYFVDDNFIVLRDQPGPAAQFLTAYSSDNVRTALSAFDAVLVSSLPLAEYFTTHRLHDDVRLLPPTLPGLALQSRAAHDSLTLAFFGGQHLHPVFFSMVLPAIRRLAESQPVRLVAVGDFVIEGSPGLTVLVLPYSPSYAAGVQALSAVGVDVLLHPVAPGQPNNEYKNPHALITALALGAIPIVSASPPYRELMQESIALFCGDSEDSWYQALVQAAQPDARQASVEHLRRFCSRRFDGAASLAALETIRTAHPRPPRWSALARRLAAGVIMARERVRRALAQFRRRSAAI